MKEDKVKIIQIIKDAWNCIIGLGDDGKLYKLKRGSQDKWYQYVHN